MDTLLAACDKIHTAAYMPAMMIMHPRSYARYSFELHKFNVWASYSPRLFLPSWWPRRKRDPLRRTLR